MISTEVQQKAGKKSTAELQAYVDRVYALLRQMQPGHKKIESLANADTKDLFIECIKQYMRETPWQGYLSFNADFTEIIKHEVF